MISFVNPYCELRFRPLFRPGSVSLSGQECSYVVRGGPCSCNVKLEDDKGNVVAFSTEPEGILAVKEAKLWWPAFTSNKTDVGYTYKLTVLLITQIKFKIQRNLGWL